MNPFWNRFGESVDAPSLLVLEGRLDGALSKLVWWKVMESQAERADRATGTSESNYYP